MLVWLKLFHFMTDITIEPSLRVKFEKGPAFVFDTFDFKDVSYMCAYLRGGNARSWINLFFPGLRTKECRSLILESCSSNVHFWGVFYALCSDGSVSFFRRRTYWNVCAAVIALRRFAERSFSLSEKLLLKISEFLFPNRRLLQTSEPFPHKYTLEVFPCTWRTACRFL